MQVRRGFFFLNILHSKIKQAEAGLLLIYSIALIYKTLLLV